MRNVKNAPPLITKDTPLYQFFFSMGSNCLDIDSYVGNRRAPVPLILINLPIRKYDQRPFGTHDIYRYMFCAPVPLILINLPIRKYDQCLFEAQDS